ncbi:MAG TPA: hypothetical protein VG847_05805 [Chitinophagaceae bacterium]|nr:hypothetical protein [Chitinophagaceae bacterium]
MMLTAIAIDDEPVALDVIKNLSAKIPFIDLKATFTNAFNVRHRLQPRDDAMNLHPHPSNGLILRKHVVGLTYKNMRWNEGILPEDPITSTCQQPGYYVCNLIFVKGIFLYNTALCLMKLQIPGASFSVVFPPE